MTRETFEVHGLPQPQGSTRAFVVKGKPVITSANKNLKSWRDLVALAAQDKVTLREGAVALYVTFWLPRPKSLPKGVIRHTKRPDADKLLRATCDALTHVAWNDDSQITLALVMKLYADEAHPPGARITVADDL